MYKAVLLDLGNVVIGVDFNRVFTSWAQAAQVPEEVFLNGWSMDDAYRAHEVGDIDFATYAESLSAHFGVELSTEAWLAGWNDIWTQPFGSVITLLPKIAERYPLYGFTNTNNAHADYWQNAFATELASFRKIYVSSHIGLRKPEADAFQYICADMQFEPQDILFLDDTQENVEGAQNAGLNAELVKSEAEVAAALSRLL